MDIFKHLILDDHELEYNFFKSVQDLLENYDHRGDGKVDFRLVEVVEAWMILKRRAYEDVLIQVQEMQAPEIEDLPFKPYGIPEAEPVCKKKTRKKRRRKNCAVCKTPLVGKQRILCGAKSCSNKHYRKK